MADTNQGVVYTGPGSVEVQTSTTPSWNSPSRTTDSCSTA